MPPSIPRDGPGANDAHIFGELVDEEVLAVPCESPTTISVAPEFLRGAHGREGLARREAPEALVLEAVRGPVGRLSHAATPSMSTEM